MARRLRLQFPGTRYHAINRGNLPHDLFATAGARRSLVGVTGEACGKFGWRKALAREHAHLALTPELSPSEVKELRSEGWERALESALPECGRLPAELASAPKSAPWQRALARKLRDAVAPPYLWLAEKLCMGKPGSVRAYVHAAGPRVVGSD